MVRIASLCNPAPSTAMVARSRGTLTAFRRAPHTQLLGVPSLAPGPTAVGEPTLTRFMMKYSSMERYTMKKMQDHGLRE